MHACNSRLLRSCELAPMLLGSHVPLASLSQTHHAHNFAVAATNVAR